MLTRSFLARPGQVVKRELTSFSLSDEIRGISFASSSKQLARAASERISFEFEDIRHVTRSRCERIFNHCISHETLSAREGEFYS